MDPLQNDTIKTVRGGLGTLAYVHSNALSTSPSCYIVIDYEGEMYVGTLLFGDSVFCNQIRDLLKLQLNRPIKEIGDLDLLYTL